MLHNDEGSPVKTSQKDRDGQIDALVKEKALVDEIWKTHGFVHNQLVPLKRRAHSIKVYYESGSIEKGRFIPPRKKDGKTKEPDQKTSPKDKDKVSPEFISSREWKKKEPPLKDYRSTLTEPLKAGDVLTWANDLSKWATADAPPSHPKPRAGSSSHPKPRADPHEVIDCLFLDARKAGILLGPVERLMGAYHEVRSSATIHERFHILSSARTIVFTARDLVDTVQGHRKNLLAHIGLYEMKYLLVEFLFLGILYVIFHPVSGSFPLHSDLRPLYEVFFWSVFGAILMSVILIAVDKMKERFDPRQKQEYMYRIPLAPAFAYVAILFLGLTGVMLAQGDARQYNLGLDPANPNYPMLILLSFLLGFFSRRVLRLFDQAWRTLMPYKAGDEEESETKKE